MSSNVKVHRNPDRDKPIAHKKYVPQYQLMGIEPEEIRSSVVPGTDVLLSKAQPLPPTNPRSRRAPVRQPYARVIPSPVGRGRDIVPNVGNNMEHTWSSVDGEIIDDLPQEIDGQEMIDNNDFVTDESLAQFNEFEPPFEEEVHQVKPSKPFLTEKDLKDVIDSELTDLTLVKENEYLLLVDGVIFATGPLEHIQEETRLLVFGEHELCDGNALDPEDLVILKRVKIKIGVFLE